MCKSNWPQNHVLWTIQLTYRLEEINFFHAGFKRQMSKYADETFEDPNDNDSEEMVIVKPEQ